MNSQYSNKNTDPNKVKKCNCEDKHGPKPFNNSTSKNNYNTKSN